MGHVEGEHTMLKWEELYLKMQIFQGRITAAGNTSHSPVGVDDDGDS
jgi:hypothetical protein